MAAALLAEPTDVGAAEQQATAILHYGAGDAKANELMTQACALAKLATVKWEKTSDGGWPALEPPVLALGTLRDGERRLPAVLAAATRVYPGLPVVLIASESLARLIVVLNRGHVSLVDPSISVDRLAAYIARLVRSGNRGLNVVFGINHIRTFRPLGGWAAAITKFPSAREINEFDLNYPWVAANAEKSGLVAVLPNWSEIAQFTPAITSGLRLAFFAPTVIDMPDAVAKVTNAPFSGLAFFGEQLRYYSSSKQGCLWLLSPRRLPAVTRLEAATAAFDFTLQPGDVVVAHTQADWQPKTRAPLLGADLLRLLQDDLLRVGQPWAATIYEVW